jgi:arylformamidase
MPNPRTAAWIDVSVPIRNGMHEWPGDAPFESTVVADVDRGDDYSLTKNRLTWHLGTHMDAPGHFVRGGARIDQFPLEAGMGPARVVGISHPRLVTAAELRRCAIRRGERILFRTRNSNVCWKAPRFSERFVAIAADAAQLLAERRVTLVGIDYLSIDPYESTEMAAHKILLGAGVWVIEGLNLSRVSPGRYDLACLPLRIEGGDGSPVRAMLKSRRRNVVG